MLAHQIHGGDRRPRSEQPLVKRNFVRKRKPFGRCRQQRRATAGNESDDEIILRQALDRVDQRLRRVKSGLIWDGMGRLQYFEGLTGSHRSMTRDHGAFEWVGPQPFEGFCHLACRLPGTDHHGPAFWSLRKMCPDRLIGVCCTNGCKKQIFQKCARVGNHDSLPKSNSNTLTQHVVCDDPRQGHFTAKTPGELHSCVLMKPAMRLKRSMGDSHKFQQARESHHDKHGKSRSGISTPPQ